MRISNSLGANCSRNRRRRFSIEVLRQLIWKIIEHLRSGSRRFSFAALARDSLAPTSAHFSQHAFCTIINCYKYHSLFLTRSSLSRNRASFELFSSVRFRIRTTSIISKVNSRAHVANTNRWQAFWNQAFVLRIVNQVISSYDTSVKECFEQSLQNWACYYGEKELISPLIEIEIRFASSAGAIFIMIFLFRTWPVSIFKARNVESSKNRRPAVFSHRLLSASVSYQSASSIELEWKLSALL